jgi:flagellar protein FlaG
MQRTISGISAGNYHPAPSSITPEKKALEQTRPRAETVSANKANTEATAAPASEPSKSAVVSKTVEFANTMAALFNTTLSFNFDERIGQVVVRVREGNTDEVIRQIPPEHMVELAANFKNQLRGLIVNRQG